MRLPRLPDANSWPEEILEEARLFFNGTITILKPGEPGTWDPVTDTTVGGTDPVVVLGPRPARAQHVRTSSEDRSAHSLEIETRYRFQCEILPADAPIEKGLVAHFDGGRDPELAKLTFQVLRALNSSHAALRTIETVSEGARA